MREFNLEEAKAGKPVCTRDGRKARIICFDVKCDDVQPIIGLIDMGTHEEMYWFREDGHFLPEGKEHKDDLFMATEKHEGWVNILEGSSTTTNLNRYFSGIFSTKEEAQKYNTDNIIDCVKIEWEE